MAREILHHAWHLKNKTPNPVYGKRRRSDLPIEEKAGIKGEGGGMASWDQALPLVLVEETRTPGLSGPRRPCIQVGTRGLIFRLQSQGRVSIRRRHRELGAFRGSFWWRGLKLVSHVTRRQGRGHGDVLGTPHCKGGCELFACTMSHAPSSCLCVTRADFSLRLGRGKQPVKCSSEPRSACKTHPLCTACARGKFFPKNLLNK